MKRDQEPTRFCANEGCGRTAQPGEPLCETCAIERSLYSRETRRAFAESSAEKPVDEEERSAFGTMTR